MATTIDELVGARLKEALSGAGLTYEQFGEKLRPHLGSAWSKASVYDVRKGRRSLRFVEMVAFARVLKRPVFFFFDAEAEGLKTVALDAGKSIESGELLDLFKAAEARSVKHEVFRARLSLREAKALLEELRGELTDADSELSAIPTDTFLDKQEGQP